MADLGFTSCSLAFKMAFAPSGPHNWGMSLWTARNGEARGIDARLSLRYTRLNPALGCAFGQELYLPATWADDERKVG
jgi:hypothetical protein